jgi:hypothetical protein
LAALGRPKVSRWINPSSPEWQNGTDWHRNARKVRKTHTFSKDWRVYESMTYFTMLQFQLRLARAYAERT